MVGRMGRMGRMGGIWLLGVVDKERSEEGGAGRCGGACALHTQ